MLKKESAFTLIEMLIVLLIISMLIILIVPNLSSKTKGVDEQGCKALKAVVQGQINLYYLDNKVYPTTIQQLVDEDYLTDEQTKCSNGEILVINDDHDVESQ